MFKRFLENFSGSGPVICDFLMSLLKIFNQKMTLETEAILLLFVLLYDIKKLCFLQGLSEDRGSNFVLWLEVKIIANVITSNWFLVNVR
jgi:hypothetical protein